MMGGERPVDWSVALSQGIPPRALRSVLVAAWRRIIGGRHAGNSGAADARVGAYQSGQQDRGDTYRRYHVGRERRPFFPANQRRDDRYAARGGPT
jgi:hypothetical protein